MVLSVVPSYATARSAGVTMFAKSLAIDVRTAGHSADATAGVMFPIVVFGRAIRTNRQPIHRSPDSAADRAFCWSA